MFSKLFVSLKVRETFWYSKINIMFFLGAKFALFGYHACNLLKMKIVQKTGTF